MYHDAYNQLITVDDFWNSATQYRYNASGSRYMRRTGTQAAVYTLRDGSVSVGEYSGSVSTTNWNILLPSGEIVGRQPFSNNPVYYLKDHLGSTRATISSTGAVLESVDYYPFGLEMPGRVTLSGQPTLQRFTGYERVDGERFDYAQARWYDPVIGRFLSVDPLAESYRAWNGYTYTLNNPIRYIDPTGLCPQNSNFAERGCLTNTMIPMTAQETDEQRKKREEEERGRRGNTRKYVEVNSTSSLVVGGAAGIMELGFATSQDARFARSAAIAKNVGGVAGPVAIGTSFLLLIYDATDPDISLARLAYRTTGFGLSLGTTVVLSPYLTPAGAALAGTGVSLIFSGGEILYDNRHVPRHNLQDMRRDLLWEINNADRAFNRGWVPRW